MKKITSLMIVLLISSIIGSMPVMASSQSEEVITKEYSESIVEDNNSAAMEDVDDSSQNEGTENNEETYTTDEVIIEEESTETITPEIIMEDDSTSVAEEILNEDIYVEETISEDIEEEQVVGSASITEGIYCFYTVLNNRECYASLANGTTSEGGNIQTTAYSGSNALRFEVLSLGNGYYKILSVKTGYALTESSGNVQQNAWKSSTTQQWIPTKSGNAYRWKNRSSGKYLNVLDANSKYTTNINTIALSGISKSAQIEWYLEPTGINVQSCGISVPDQGYTGKAIIPAPTVFYNGEQLIQGKDYTVSCTNNINRGTASLTITGIGTYTGTKTVPFKITTLISKATITGVGSTYRYTGSAIKPTPKIKLNGTALVAGTDYTVSYTNNVNVGTGRVTITGKGNYGGTSYKDFFIIKCANSITNNGTYYIITHDNPSSALAVDGMKNNSHILLADRRVTELQKFQLVKNSDGTYKIYSARSGLVIASAQNKKVAGNMAVLYENTGKAAQNWKIVKNSDNSFSFQNPTLALSLGANTPGGYAYTGAGTILRMCTTQDITSQKFWLVKCADVNKPMEGTYTIGCRNTRFVLQTTNSSKENNANTVLMTKSGVLSQTYKVVYAGSGYYRIINANSGKVLGMNGDSKTSGVNVRQETWTASRDQRWKFTKNNDGTYGICNMDGIYLSASSNNIANGRNVNARSKTTAIPQSWKLTRK